MSDAPNVSDTSGGAFRILESITDAFFALDRAFRFTYVNAPAERLLSRTREELLGRSLWDEFPQAVGSAFERYYRRVLDEQVAVTFEEFLPSLAAWFEVRAFPSPDGLSVFFHDVTAQVERRRRERFLADLAERARGISDPDEVIADAVHSVGEFFGVSRCLFADIDIEADTCAIHPHYRADESVLDIAGVVPISAFGAFVVAEYAARRAVVVDDVRMDTLRVPPETLGAYVAFGIIAHVTVPAVHSGRVVSCMSVHSATPRPWAPADVELLRAVVERTWLTVEVTRQERALVREAGERREAAERTASILESITDAFFTLDRDWRVTRVNDQAERLMTKTRDQLLGRNFWEAHPGLIGSTFEREYSRAMAESVAVSFEIFYPPLDAWLEVRAYPSIDGLSVFYQDVSARKRAEEARRESEERYRLLLESTGEGIYGIDLMGRFTFVNHAAARMLGFTATQIVGQSGHG